MFVLHSSARAIRAMPAALPNCLLYFLPFPLPHAAVVIFAAVCLFEVAELPTEASFATSPSKVQKRPQII